MYKIIIVIIMGVDFTSFSNVIIKPIPLKYRPKKIKKNPMEIQDKIKIISSLPDNMKMLYMMINNMSINENKEITAQNELKISPEAELWNKKLEEDKDFIRIDWNNNKIYYESEDTNVESTGRSYSGYSDFIDYCQNYINFRYILPSCDSAPDNGLITDKNKIKMFLEDLEKLKPIFDKLDNDFDNHKWFFDEFYKMVENALDNGIITIF